MRSSRSRLDTLGYTDAADGRVMMMLDAFSLGCTAGGCALSPSRPSAPSAVDFDLFLLNRTTMTWGYGSQSVDDVHEGFDIITDESDGEGEYEVWLGWPDDLGPFAEGCDGTAQELLGSAWELWGLP